MNRNTRRITQGALLAALTAVVLLANRYLGGFFNGILFWILPVPLIIYAISYGFKNSLIVCAAVAILAFITSTPDTLIEVIAAVLLGSVYGWGLSKGKSNAWLLGCAVIGALLWEISTVWIFAGIYGLDIAEEVRLMEETLAQAGLSLPANWNLTSIFYMGIVFTGVMEGALIHMITYLIMRRLKLPFPQFIPFTEMKLPVWVAVYTIITGAVFAYFRFTDLNGPYVQPAFMISMPGLLAAAFFGYVAFVRYARMANMPYFGFLLVIGLFLLTVPVVYGLAGAGLADAFFGERGSKSRQLTGRKL